MQGGSRSGKTYNILIWFIVKLLQETGMTLTIVRQSLPSIKGTVLRDFIDILVKLNIYSEDNHNKTDQIYSLNGNIIEFVSADQPQKIRGRARNYLFCNEANELSYEAWMQLIMRTEGKIVIDYNPSDVSSWIYDNVIPRDDSDFHITTFMDNPFLPKELVDELTRLKDADPNYWQIYGLGERGLSQDLIYTHYRTTENMPEDGQGEVVYGCDFGFNNPSALVKCVFYDGVAYLQELIYQTKLTTNDLVDKIKELGLSQMDEIYCDAAEPKTIEELVRNGFNAKPANKDVTEGIRCLKGTPLTIHQDSLNLLKELKSYRWKTDRNGNKLDQPVKFADHVCFIGETLITISDGLKRIDTITEKDFVLTSEGYRKVNKLFKNGVHRVEKYLMQFDTFELTLICTPNHLIKTNEGWTEISKLQSGMTIYHDNFIKGNPLSCNLVKDTLTMEEIKCTGLFGNVSEELDQKDYTSIIKMETHGTITLTTLNSLKPTSTYQHISNKELKITQNGLQNFTKKELQQHQNGIKAKQDLSGIVNTQKDVTLENLNTLKQTAYNVEKNILKNQITQSFAIQTVKLKHLEVEGSWSEKVYDLNIIGVHEYFANGILVHNCDAARYAIYSKLTIPSVTWGVI
jgi:phage terminase large subunit